MPAFQERILYHSQNKQKYSGLKIFSSHDNDHPYWDKGFVQETNKNLSSYTTYKNADRNY